jgi:hypothetical protein
LARRDTLWPRNTALLGCAACDFAWFSHRYDRGTLAALYSGYRGDRYLTVRRRWEPWYSASFNRALEPGSEAVEERVGFMVGMLGDALDVPNLRNIVDYGGDAGQFFPPAFAGPKFVLEVSGKTLVPGVQAVRALTDVPGGSPHMVIAAHLLEHLVDPVGLVREIREAVAADGFLYVEVPLDRPRVRRWHTTGAYDRFLGLCRRWRPTWILADFAAGAARNLGWRVPWLGAVKQSEHINYFSERSLDELLTRGGFRVLRMVADPRASLHGLRLGRLGALAVIKENAR